MNEERKVINNTGENRFEVGLGEQLAMIEYIEKDGAIIFTHTGVPPEFGGQGIAAMMAREALEYAKENKLKVTSLCSFIDAYLNRHPEYKALL